MAARRVVVVTGASRGIGRAIALAYAAQGWHVVAGYRREAALARQTEELIRAHGGTVESRQVDVSDPAQAGALFEGLSRVDVLVNNAGMTRDAPLPMMTREDWQAVLATNLHGIYQCTRAVVPMMCAAGSGVIVHIGSSASVSARSGQANYASAKSALIGFTRSLGRELAPHGVRTVMVAPGYTATDMAQAVPEATASEALRRIPLGRWARPEEVSAAVLFFASDMAAGFNGHTVLVDGGRTVFEMEYGL